MAQQYRAGIPQLGIRVQLHGALFHGFSHLPVESTLSVASPRRRRPIPQRDILQIVYPLYRFSFTFWLTSKKTKSRRAAELSLRARRSEHQMVRSLVTDVGTVFDGQRQVTARRSVAGLFPRLEARAEIEEDSR